jgi:hypothetical protein
VEVDQLVVGRQRVEVADLVGLIDSSVAVLARVHGRIDVAVIVSVAVPIAISIAVPVSISIAVPIAFAVTVAVAVAVSISVTVTVPIAVASVVVRRNAATGAVLATGG